MTSQTLIEATSGGIGEELNDLFGYASTRLSSIVLPEQQIQTAYLNMNYNGNVTISITSGTLALSIAGMRLRILSGASIGKEAIILSRDTSTQLTLVASFPNPASFTGQSWEIVEDAETTLSVENALDFASAPGRLVMDSVVYFYTGKTANTFTGISYDDGTGLIIQGVKKEHIPPALISDYSKAKSALDIYRRSFLVEFATGKDLDVIGNNLGVERPPELTSDDTYRELIMALAYAPRGTIFAMEQVLDVLLGETVIASGTENAIGTGDPFIVQITSGTYPTGIEGFRFRVKSGYMTDRTIRIAERVDSTHIRLNLPMEENFSLESWEITDPNWELFEDLTLGSIHHGCEVFFRRKDDQEEISAGKTFLDGEHYRPLASTSTINFSSLGRLKIASVRLKDEGGEQIVASGTSNASSVNGKVVTGTFSSLVKPADFFRITSGILAGQIGVVQTRDSGSQITLGLLDGCDNPSGNSVGTIGKVFSGVSWEIYRTKTNCRYYKPSSESRIEHPTDSGTVSWAYLGASESSRVLIDSDSTYGPRLQLVPGGNLVGYNRVLRITPEAEASVEMLLDIGTGLTTTSTHGKQICCALSDGERVLAWGCIDTGGNLQSRIGFISMVSGSFIGTTPSTKAVWSDVGSTKYTPGLGAIRIVKTGRDLVRLYKQSWQGAYNTTGWKLIDEIAYSSFPTVAAWSGVAPYTTNDHQICWGTLEAGHSNNTIVKYVDWSVNNNVDFWNLHGTAETSDTDELEDLSAPFVVGDVGNLIRIKDFGDVNSDGGNALGIWQVASRPNTSHLILTGETQWRGYFDLTNPRALFIRGSSPFTWPDNRGHSIEILTGVNAGTYPIVAIINPETGESYDLDPATATITDSINWTNKDAIQLSTFSHVIELDTGLVNFDSTDLECSWRMLPNFPIGDTDVDYELIDVGTDSSGNLTLRAAMPFATGTVVGVYASKVLSGYLFHEREGNTFLDEGPPQEYSMYPFYLHDSFGYVRSIMEIVKAAGIKMDFENLFRDTAGLHLLDNIVSGSEGAPQEFVFGGTTGLATTSGTISARPLYSSITGVASTSGTLVGLGALSGSTSGLATTSGTI